MTFRIVALLVVMALQLCPASAAANCNGIPEPCRIAEGTYHIVLPAETTGPRPAVMLLHGYGGEGVGFIRNKGMVDVLLARGYAVIAPDGQMRVNGKGRSWDFYPDRPATRDETAFLIAVADHAAATYGLDRQEILLAGFSIGGSMTSYVACQEPGAFAAYAPLAGSFWRPHPADCAGPVRLLHTHGTADKTVPMVGRAITPDFVQGNVLEAMEIWRETNGCMPTPEQDVIQQTIFRVSHWTGCTPGSDLSLALHDGGHSIPKGWIPMTLDWFEKR